jgi:hypothetical protein
MPLTEPVRLLPLRLSADYPLEEQPGSPKFLTVPFVIMPWSQAPGSNTAHAIPYSKIHPISDLLQR